MYYNVFKCVQSKAFRFFSRICNDDLEKDNILAVLTFATRLTQVKSIYQLV